MNNINNFIAYKPCTDCVIISCKLGHWTVQGDYTKETAEKAEKLYMKYKALGKYNKIPQEKKNEGFIKIK